MQSTDQNWTIGARGMAQSIELSATNIRRGLVRWPQLLRAGGDGRLVSTAGWWPQINGDAERLAAASAGLRVRRMGRGVRESGVSGSRDAAS